jgi:hypothetical protein
MYGKLKDWRAIWAIYARERAPILGSLLPICGATR